MNRRRPSVLPLLFLSPLITPYYGEALGPQNFGALNFGEGVLQRHLRQEICRRLLGARTHEALLEAMEEALSKVTPAEAVGWFNHCGYEVEVQYL